MADLLWARCRGRNGWDSPVDLPDDVAAEAVNMHRDAGALGMKRGGSTAQTLTGDTHSGYNALSRFQPAQDPTAAELFIVSSDATPKILRVAAGTAKVNLTLKDNISSRAWDVSTATLNGKHYFAYDSAVNRLHVFDPGLSTTEVRRAGFGTPAAPALATLGGAGLTFTRYVKVAYTEQRAGVTVRRSELSAATAITISDDSGFSITKPAALSEGETHWEAYVSETLTGTYYLDATTVVGTGAYNYSDASVDTTTAEPSAGANVPFPSVKFLATDGNRLLGYGVWETSAGDSLAPKAGRVFIGPVLDSSSVHDDERINNTTSLQGWIDISRNAGSSDRGLSPEPLNNIFYVFQDRGIAMLVPTENAAVPYRRVVLSSRIGAVNQQSLVMAEDEAGRPCLYFLDPELGPYRIGTNGLQRCGKDVADLWSTVNLGATGQVAWGTYHKALNLVLFAVATGASNDPDTILALDVTEGEPTANDGVRYGWYQWTGDFPAARCGVQFSSTMGASMSRAQTTFAGRNSDTKLLRYNPSATQDDSTSFRGYLRSRAFEGPNLTREKTIQESFLLATAQSGVTLTQAYVRNFGDETNRSDAVTLTPSGSESRVLRRFESGELAGAFVFQVEIGDAAAANSAWTLERWWSQFSEKARKGNP